MPSSSYSIHVLLFLFFFYSSIAAEESSNSLESACKPTLCGNESISSPFWIRGTSARTYDCGYSGFGIDCFNNTPIFNLSNGNYSVQNISYSDYTFTLVDMAANETCPRARHNVSIDPHLPLNFSSSADLINLSFYFNCTKGLGHHAPNISCLKSGEDLSFVFVKGKEPEGIPWGRDCDEVVEVKVKDGEIDQERNLIGGYVDAMRKGFELNWEQFDDCEECRRTGGRCGVSRLSDGNETFVCLCPGQDFRTSTNHCGRGGRVRLLRLLLPVGLVVSGLLLLGCFGYYYWRKLSTWFKKTILCNEFKEDQEENLESFIRNHQTMASRRYTYNDIKRITNSFKERLGEGGYGTVYKGKLLDKDKEKETHVAVKILKKLKGSGEDFVNEVSSISRTSHVNVVNLMGFCLDNGKRALVYEFMPNGSLDKFIHKDFVRLGKWGKLRQIAIGIARGLEYLHLGCNTRILHFDIKPQNILLDENDIPKISDFGLAKMCAKNESIVSMVGARGTIGYIAPEIVSRILGQVSYKSDVYSYGMLVLEMIGVGKGMHSPNENIMEESSDVYFPHYVYKHLQRDNIEMLLHGDMQNEEIDIARKMILVGLWCIQMDPSRRPHMSKVVEMLEGSLDAMQNPPNPSDHCSDFMGNSSFNSMVDDSLCSFK